MMLKDFSQMHGYTCEINAVLSRAQSERNLGYRENLEKIQFFRLNILVTKQVFHTQVVNST